MSRRSNRRKDRVSTTSRAWLSGKTPAGFGDVRQHHVAYMRWLDRRLEIERPEQWYGVTVEPIADHHGVTLTLDQAMIIVVHFAQDSSLLHFLFMDFLKLGQRRTVVADSDHCQVLPNWQVIRHWRTMKGGRSDLFPNA